MCPTYVATGEEIMSTRGRANILRAVLEHRIDPDKHPLDSEALDEALGYCLSCKACTTECPSNVNMALLKAETYYARIKREGVSLRERLVSNFDALGRLGCAFPALANTTIRWMWVRKLMERTAGFTHKRPLPPFAKQRFDHWFKKRRNGKADAPRGRVLLWDDCFVRYNEPHIGQAAVKVLETAGYEVALLEGRRCCGRTAFSVGRLDVAKKWGEHNVALIREKYPEDPIVFLEPSCYSMFHEDYRELKVPGAAGIAERCNLFEHFLLELLEREPEALEFDGAPSRVAIHSHCHAKSLTDTGAFEKLAERMPGAEATALKTGCCGMAGVFGQLKDKYETSLQVAEPLIEQVNAAHKEGAAVVASGTSCRSQVTHLSGAKPLHMAEVLAEALTRRNGGAG
jgi:Fe-S oxidoreductase